MENEGTAPRILNLDTSCRRVLSALSTPGTDGKDCWMYPRDSLDLSMAVLRPWMVYCPLTKLTTSGLNFGVVHLVTFCVQDQQQAVATCFGRYQATFRLYVTCKIGQLTDFGNPLTHNRTEHELSGNKQ